MDQSVDSDDFESHPIPAVDLKEPGTEVEDLPRYPPRREPTPKGIFGAAVRKLKNIPPCVWVVNQHSEEITVVVSKYKPNRILTGMGVNASPTGVGLHFETMTFVGPASRKTLAAQDQGREESTAVFPLWTRKEGFGVISVFKGPEKILYIENDMVPLGATVYFANKPDLRIVKYQSGSVPIQNQEKAGLCY
ncbi:hypothetical protein N7491_009995 [Penicillium cf. griseofulvum]|uniref:Uncharacterized protein n=1 Tax=Penicillium cf. griseofulvum TaxID=2972120 RepID=A0A9W9MZT6_9EURO|nr:hypothetical protein N7472_000327 [Penicillium cf. griseofulvum]KAJ5421550.1 hypothetical protein N7491_009995 [Penicillium cf. griseofulvum]KAJ5424786.1 hypothetical protein N7445_010759 [Penicillium cf. griseofulvum]